MKIWSKLVSPKTLMKFLFTAKLVKIFTDKSNLVRGAYPQTVAGLKTTPLKLLFVWLNNRVHTYLYIYCKVLTELIHVLLLHSFY